LKITAIRLDRMRLPLDPPFYAAWDPLPRRHFDATLVTVHTDEGITGYGSGDTMDGFEPFEPLFTGRDPLAIADHVRVIESIGFHAGRYWPLEAALWDIIGQVTGQPVSVLFGGATRRLPAYASFGEARSPQDRPRPPWRQNRPAFER
jgi:D-galactarolactone cycloisomerase